MKLALLFVGMSIISTSSWAHPGPSVTVYHGCKTLNYDTDPTSDTEEMGVFDLNCKEGKVTVITYRQLSASTLVTAKMTGIVVTVEVTDQQAYGNNKFAWTVHKTKAE